MNLGQLNYVVISSYDYLKKSTANGANGHLATAQKPVE